MFQRAYETVSLMNVDYFRSRRGLRGLDGTRLAPVPLPGDAVEPRDQALGSQDALRAPLERVAAPTRDEPLPLAQHAREKHRSISDLRRLKGLLALDPGRLRDLVRRPFEVEPGEGGGATTMRMPPFMRASNANPLTLAAWQYDLLMRWADAAAPGAVAAVAEAGPAETSPKEVPRMARLSEGAARRQRSVLGRLA